MARKNLEIKEDLDSIALVDAACRLVGIPTSERNIRFIIASYKAIESEDLDLSLRETVFLFNQVTKLVNDNRSKLANDKKAK